MVVGERVLTLVFFSAPFALPSRVASPSPSPSPCRDIALRGELCVCAWKRTEKGLISTHNCDVSTRAKRTVTRTQNERNNLASMELNRRRGQEEFQREGSMIGRADDIDSTERSA